MTNRLFLAKNSYVSIWVSKFAAALFWEFQNGVQTVAATTRDVQNIFGFFFLFFLISYIVSCFYFTENVNLDLKSFYVFTIRDSPLGLNILSTNYSFLALVLRQLLRFLWCSLFIFNKILNFDKKSYFNLFYFYLFWTFTLVIEKISNFNRNNCHHDIF